MQKKLIALAIAGLSGAAFAQSNVTVYGVADMYYANATASGKTSQTVINSGGLAGSRLGFTGTEALGNGMTALFKLEYGLGVDANAGIGTGDSGVNGVGNEARQQLLGLTGGFGTVVAGYAQTAGYDFECATNPVAGSALDAASKVGANALLTCGKGGRAGNAAAYVSPNFGGFTFAYNHARVTEDANAQATNKDASANLLYGSYANGPLSGSMVWSKIDMAQTAADDNITEWGLTGAYDLKMVKLFGAYQNMKVGSASADNKWQISGAIPFGASTVALQYAKSNIKSTAASDDSTAWTLAYTYALSKRTTAYTGYTRVTNDSAAARGALIAPTAGGNSGVFAAGLNHKF